MRTLSLALALTILPLAAGGCGGKSERPQMKVGPHEPPPKVANRRAAKAPQVAEAPATKKAVEPARRPARPDRVAPVRKPAPKTAKPQPRERRAEPGPSPSPAAKELPPPPPFDGDKLALVHVANRMGEIEPCG